MGNAQARRRIRLGCATFTGAVAKMRRQRKGAGCTTAMAGTGNYQHERSNCRRGKHIAAAAWPLAAYAQQSAGSRGCPLYPQKRTWQQSSRYVRFVPIATECTAAKLHRHPITSSAVASSVASNRSPARREGGAAHQRPRYGCGPEWRSSRSARNTLL
jgi:hypothetical protein